MVTELTPSILNLYINNAWCVIDGEEWIISHRIAEDFARKKIDVKPILRAFISITQEEIDEFHKVTSYTEPHEKQQVEAEPLVNAESKGLVFLAQKGIDIFGLIASGVAIEKTQ